MCNFYILFRLCQNITLSIDLLWCARYTNPGVFIWSERDKEMTIKIFWTWRQNTKNLITTENSGEKNKVREAKSKMSHWTDQEAQEKKAIWTDWKCPVLQKKKKRKSIISFSFSMCSVPAVLVWSSKLSYIHICANIHQTVWQCQQPKVNCCVLQGQPGSHMKVFEE